MRKKLMQRLLRPVALGAITTLIALLFHFSGSSSSLAQSSELFVAPDAANPGATIMVTGFNYPAQRMVEVYFQSRAHGVTRAVTNAVGFFAVPLTLPRMYIRGSADIFAVCGSSTTRGQLHFAAPTLRRLSADRASTFHASRSAPVIYKGTGFLANEHVGLALHTSKALQNVGTSMTNERGEFTFQLSSHTLPFNSHATLTAYDDKHQSASTALQTIPAIWLEPFAAHVGQTVTVSGSGFGRGEEVQILFQGYKIAVGYTDVNGNFSGSFAVPTFAKGAPYTSSVYAYGMTTRVGASASFQVMPTVLLSPNAGSPGDTVTVQGWQFSPNSQVQVVLQNPNKSASSAGQSVTAFATTAQGSFSSHFTIPTNVERGMVYSFYFVNSDTGNSAIAYFRVYAISYLLRPPRPAATRR